MDPDALQKRVNALEEGTDKKGDTKDEKDKQKGAAVVAKTDADGDVKMEDAENVSSVDKCCLF